MITDITNLLVQVSVLVQKAYFTVKYTIKRLHALTYNLLTDLTHKADIVVYMHLAHRFVLQFLQRKHAYVDADKIFKVAPYTF